MPPEVSELGPLETWQVWAVGSQGKQGVIEVTAPRDMLPYAVVREAYRCRLQMDVMVEVVRGGVRLSAKPIPPPPEVKKALEEIKKEIEASGGTVEGAIETIKEEAEKLGYVAGLSPTERETIREKAKTAGAAVVFEDEVKP